MKWAAALVIVAVGAGMGDAPANAWTGGISAIPPQTQGRLDTLGRFVGNTPYCEALGYSLLDRDGHVLSREVSTIASRVGIDPSDAEAAVRAAAAREANETRTALEKVQANLGDARQDGAVRAFADELAVTCDRAANDPVASVLIKPPPGRVSVISRRYVDLLLAPQGRASWQSQYVLAGGDLAEAVGACEQHIGRGPGRAYLADLRDPTRFDPNINDTIQAWLDQRMATGRESARKAPPNAAQCRLRLAKQKAAFAKAPVD